MLGRALDDDGKPAPGIAIQVRGWGLCCMQQTSTGTDGPASFTRSPLSFSIRMAVPTWRYSSGTLLMFSFMTSDSSLGP